MIGFGATHRIALIMLGSVVILLEAVLIHRGLPLRILDARLFYPPAEIATLFEQQGAAGREQYLWITGVDLAFIASYTTWLFLFAMRLQDKARPASRALPWLVFLPGLVDLIETTGIRALLRSYPESSSWLTIVVSLATPIKWLAFILLFTTMLRIQLRKKHPDSKRPKAPGA